MTRLFGILLVLGPTIAQNVRLPGPGGAQPEDVQKLFDATKTEHGILVKSTASDDQFSIELVGDQIKALSSERISLSIDGLIVSLATVHVAAARNSGSDPVSASRSMVIAELQQQGWRLVNNGPEMFPLPTGLECTSWEMARVSTTQGKREQNLVALCMLNQNNAGYLTASFDEKPELLKRASSFLKASLSTLKIGDDSGRRLIPEPSDIGVLYNKDMMTPDDQKGGGVGLSPDQLLEVARLVMDLGDRPLMLSIFDGHTAHMVLLLGYDLKNDTFEYSDTTGSRSFLEAGRNLADVRAVRSAKEERTWTVKSDELARVAHGLISLTDAKLVALRDVVSNPASATFGFIGEGLDTALKTDLFNWFGFKQVNSAKEINSRDVLSFRPGGQWHDRIALNMTVDRSRKIYELELTVGRTFVDDSRDSVFAADLVTSFLKDATPMKDLTFIAPFAGEINIGALRVASANGLTMLRHSSAWPQRASPPEPTAAYLTYRGQLRDFDKALTTTRLHLKNRPVGGVASLVVTITR